MNYRTAKMSLSIKILTGIILVVVVGSVIGGLQDKNLMVGGVVLGIIALVCYLLAPASYDVSNGCLTLVLHAGIRQDTRRHERRLHGQEPTDASRAAGPDL